MTSAEQKAKELVDKYLPYAEIEFDDDGFPMVTSQIKNAKQCAIIAVDEIMDENSANNVAHDCAWVMNPETNKYDITNEQFWQQVKQSIQSL
jgi:hypothetical protein